MKGPGWRTLALAFGATLAVYLLVAVRMLPYVEPPTGDQPHYLMQTISLVRDGDLDLRNNYQVDESYSAFSAPGRRREGFRGIPVAYHLDPQGHIVMQATGDGDAWYPKHSPGLPMLLVPGWAIGDALTPWLRELTALGNGAWPGTVFQMAVVGALLGAQVFLLAWEVSRRRAVAFAVWAALAFSVPNLLMSLLVYPEAVGALGTIYAFRQIVVQPLATQPWRLPIVGAVLAGLPWFNPRFVLVSGGLALLVVVALWYERQTATQAAARWAEAKQSRLRSLLPRGVLLLGPLVLSLVLLRWYQVATYGSTAAVADQYEGFYVPTMVDGQLGADWPALFLALAGLFVDRQYGLLVFAPVYALALVGLVALWRADRGRWLVAGLAVIVVPYVLLTADFRVWWGGWSPPARYLAVVTPLLALPLAHTLVALDRTRWYPVVFGLLAAAGLVVAGALLLQLGDARVDQAIFSNPTRTPPLLRWLELRLGLDLLPLLPGIAAWFSDRRDPIPWTQIAGALGLVGVVVGVCIAFLPATQGTPPGPQHDAASERGPAPILPRTGMSA